LLLFELTGQLVSAITQQWRSNFNPFAPAALAGIGSLPATLRDRSILLPLVPAADGQLTARFDPLHTEIEHPTPPHSNGDTVPQPLDSQT
jgi:hypothetical protein